MELSKILIRELEDYQLIELREVVPSTDDGAESTPGASGTGGGTGAGISGGAAGAGAKKVTYAQVEGGRSFPIVIGLPEAQAIERRLKGIQIKRPQTHDLLASVIENLGAKLESITINDLSDHTFFATLDVRDRGGNLVRIDSRPSDAIALGIAGNVPIFVEERVLDSAQNDQP
ncbi:MAG: bifunctional nuclease family protein [Phycisphaerae bacterium]|nr:bifunctional nuclease family protein [Phycisphaerae bacterium]